MAHLVSRGVLDERRGRRRRRLLPASRHGATDSRARRESVQESVCFTCSPSAPPTPSFAPIALGLRSAAIVFDGAAKLMSFLEEEKGVATPAAARSQFLSDRPTERERGRHHLSLISMRRPATTTSGRGGGGGGGGRRTRADGGGGPAALMRRRRILEQGRS